MKKKHTTHTLVKHGCMTTGEKEGNNHHKHSNETCNNCTITRLKMLAVSTIKIHKLTETTLNNREE